MASDLRSDRLFHKSVTLNKITCECPTRRNNLLFTIQDGRRQYVANSLPTNPKKRDRREGKSQKKKVLPEKYQHMGFDRPGNALRFSDTF